MLTLPPKTAAAQNLRSLLKQLGVGEFNATMIIPCMFQMPATTNPSMPQVILLTRHIQSTLGMPATGQIDIETAAALRSLIGPTWTRVTWADIATAVSAAKSHFRPPLPSRSRGNAVMTPVLDGIPDLPFLPAVPGGTLTYAALGLGAWWLLKKKR